jgi:hypothetical protein
LLSERENVNDSSLTASGGPAMRDVRLVDAGYFAKRVMPKPDWLQAAVVREVCSVSECVSPGPPDWIGHWRHNALGWYDSPEGACSVGPAGELAHYRLFAYRLLPEVFTATSRGLWHWPDADRVTSIAGDFQTIGFDVVSRSAGDVMSFECSPLSCNGLAAELAVNARCLFAGFDEAVDSAIRFAREQPEPGDYFVVEVLEQA